MANYELGNLVWRVSGETRDFDKSVTKSETGLDRLGQRATATGAKLTRGVTLPLAAVGTALIAAAVETGRYADSLLDLEQVTGLSTDSLQELEQVASDAGVSFSGLTGTLQRFSARLPGIESGTTEGAKAFAQLGVDLRGADGAIRDMDELFPDLIRSLQSVENVTERNALAQQIFGRSLQDIAPVLGMTAEEFDGAREKAHDLGLVLGKDALDSADDFRVTTADLGRQIKGLWRELAIDLIPLLQDELVPILGNVIDNVRSAVGWFTDLDDGTKKLIGTMGIMAASAGPVLGAVGALVKLKAAIIAVNTAALFGPAGIIVGIAALTAGLVTLRRRVRENRISELREEFGELAEELGIAAENLEQFVQKADAIEGALQRGAMHANFESAQEQVEALAENLDLSRREVIAIGLASEHVSDQYKDVLSQVEDELIAREQIMEENRNASIDYEFHAEMAERQQRAMAQSSRDAERQSLAAQREAATREEMNAIARDARERIRGRFELRLAELNATTEQEQHEVEILRIETERAEVIAGIADDFVRTGDEVELIHNFYDRQIEIERELLDLRIAAREEAEREREERQIENELRAARELHDIRVSLFGDETEQFEHELARQLEAYEEAGLERKELDDFEAERREEWRQEQLDAEQRLIRDQLSAWSGYASQVGDVFQSLAQIRHNLIDRETQARIDSLDEQGLSEEEYQARVKEINEQSAIDKWKVEKQLFGVKKATRVAEIALETAANIVEVFPRPELMVAAGLIGALQAGVALSQPPPPRPSFAHGGEFITDGPQQITVGDNPGGRERVSITPESSENVNGPGGGQMQIHLNLDGRTLARSTVNYINDGVVRIEV